MSGAKCIPKLVVPTQLDFEDGFEDHIIVDQIHRNMDSSVVVSKNSPEKPLNGFMNVETKHASVQTVIDQHHHYHNNNNNHHHHHHNGTTRIRKGTSVKENKYLYSFWIGNHRNGTIEQDDLRSLMLMIKKWNNDNLFKLNTKEWDAFYSFPRLHLSTKIDEDQLDPFVLQPSIFFKNNVPSTIYFNTKLTKDSRPPISLPEGLMCALFRWKLSNITPNSIRNCISFMKFTVSYSFCPDYYVGGWGKHMLSGSFILLQEWEKVNHYPGSFHLGRKDKLSYRLKSAKRRFAADSFDEFHPATFVLPRDYEELKTYWQESPSKLFIIKPPASARGNGIQVINHISQIPAQAIELPPSNACPSKPKKSTLIVQQYISNPCLLENGKKFDLRIYVLLTSVDPLRIYVHDEGLVRFASSKYTSQEEGITDQYVHLTNYFINKKNTEYKINNDCNSSNGSKWTLNRFWRYIRDNHPQVDVDKLKDKIIDIIIKAFICCEGPMSSVSPLRGKNDYSSYELFGFDIILDENFKPWILEVNITPSLKSESDLDTTVKYSVIKDMFNVVGYCLPPPLRMHAVENLLDFNLFFDPRYYIEKLTERDNIKHVGFVKSFVKLFKHNSGKSQNGDLTITINQTMKQAIEQAIKQSSKLADQTCHVPKIESPEIDSYLRNGCQDLDNHSGDRFNGEDSQSSTLTSGSILTELTQNDIRVLMLAEDELSRCGRFKRIFPSVTSAKYLKYFDTTRYYNLLLGAWEEKYRDNRLEGIKHLSDRATFLDRNTCRSLRAE